MTYREAVDYLEALADHERLGFRRHMAAEVSLDTMRALLVLLGEPHLGLRFAHIAGSKGKGSVAAMVEAVALAAGLSTGLYTSPHLISPRERIRIGGRPLGEQELADLVAAVRPAIEEIRAAGQLAPPTFFEAYTAMALLAFARHRVDLAILETGLGGRLDATNLVSPAVTAITTICREHVDILGSTLEEIAAEKAGIIKPKVPVVLGRMPGKALEVARATAQEVSAPVVLAPPAAVAQAPRLRPGDAPRPQVIELGAAPPRSYELALLGKHQADNAAVAWAMVEALRAQGLALSEEALVEGYRSVRWPGRLQIVPGRPMIVLDCAHAPAAAQALAQALQVYFQYRHLIVVLGMNEDKDVRGFAEALALVGGEAVLTRASLPRALPPVELAARVEGLWEKTTLAPAVPEAIERAREAAGPDDLVLVTGSVYVVGEAMIHLGIEA